MNIAENLYARDGHALLLGHLQAGAEAIQTRMNTPQITNERASEESFSALVKKYSQLPTRPAENSVNELRDTVADLFGNIPRWKYDLWQDGAGTSFGAAASAAYALALEESLAGDDNNPANMLVAEQAVAKIIASLAHLPHTPVGLFASGGSTTNLYGMKMGIRKALPESSHTGIYKRVQIFVSKETHFSHQSAANWLGIGTRNVIPIASCRDHTISVAELEQKLRRVLKKGIGIGSIVLGGGTVYDHAIDDIEAVVALRDELVEEFKLPYRPHIHVDSVIGWTWLMFSGYDWTKNSLDIPKETLQKLKSYYDKMKQVRLADSWGIDFHEGAGGCPVACSLIMVNRREDAALLAADGCLPAKESGILLPMERILEASRPGGAALAALMMLRALGKDGYRRQLVNLVESARYLRELLDKHPSIQVSNHKSDGFATLVRLLPPGMPKVKLGDELADRSPLSKKLSDQISGYTARFFTWSQESFIQKGEGPEYALSSNYLTTPSGAELSALKIYPLSSYFSRPLVQETAESIVARQHLFNQAVWEN